MVTWAGARLAGAAALGNEQVRKEGSGKMLAAFPPSWPGREGKNRL